MERNRIDENLLPLHEMLDAHVGDLVRPASTFVERFATDGAMEFPDAPAGGVERLVGREAIAEYLARIVDRIVITRVSDVVVHRSLSLRDVVLEYRGEGRVLRTGSPYRQRYVSIIETADGRVVRWKDYWNPTAAADAFADPA